MEPLNPFANIDPPTLNPFANIKPFVEQNVSDIIQMDKGLIQHLSSEDEKDSCDSEWEFEDGNIFDVIAQEL